MLPGFRFLFSAIVFCFSILVFGLGAAALLRAAHEQFASRPSWYPTPSTTFAQQGEPFGQQGEPTAAVLSLLEVDPDDNNDTSRHAPHDSPLEPGLKAAAIETTAAVTDPAAGKLPDTPQLAAPVAPEQPSSPITSEAASDVMPTPEPDDKLAHVEPETPLGDGSSTVEPVALIATNEPETGIAPVDETVPKAVEPSTATSEPVNVPAVVPEPVAPQIAALGRSGETTDTQARDKDASNETRAQASRNSVKNRLRAQRAKARRRVAHRAQIVRRAAVQQQQPPAAFTAIPATTNQTTTENPYRF